jgi:hypothetical protein
VNLVKIGDMESGNQPSVGMIIPAATWVESLCRVLTTRSQNYSAGGFLCSLDIESGRPSGLLVVGRVGNPHLAGATIWSIHLGIE